MRRSIFIKVFGGYFFLTIALSGLIVLFSSYLIRDYQVERTEQELKDIATIIAGQVLEMPPEKPVDDVIKTLGVQVDTRVTLIDPEGRVIADSQEDPRKMKNHRTRTEVAEAFEGRTGIYLRFSDTMGQEMLYVAIPVQKDGKTYYVLRVSKFLKDIKLVSRRLNARIMQIALIVLIVALVAAFVFVRKVYRPLGELTQAISRVAGHDFNVRVLLKEEDEIKDIADNFNAMTDEMQGLFAELTRQKEELDSIISSLQEGLLVLDSEERVLVSNQSLKAITGHSFQKGIPYWETLREPAISNLIKKVRAERCNYVEEITVHDATFLCSATYLSSKEEIVIIFHDITEIKRLEKIKSDFVLNVSHELRTPLTSIKGYIETMEDASLSDENRRYLAIIKRNTDRLINIVGDLLVLSKLEYKNSAVDHEAVNMPQLIERALKIFENQIKAKGFSVEIMVPADLPFVVGDPFKIEQAFINLLDNAIKYTDKGQITIEAAGQGSDVVISIADTGPGIPAEHIPRIFERFYVVDRSRSKKLGGTGLGLSIVKHIVLLHNGSIDVESVPGKGTKFTVTLPARIS
jgi:two-component system phosphate regulon sensor histidine kinase PhoR